MLPRINRFSFRGGIPKKTLVRPLFVIRYEKNAIGKLECGVIVGKKVHKHAVQRNRIKRITVGYIKELLLLETPYKILIYARKPIIDETGNEIKKQLRDAFKAIQII